MLKTINMTEVVPKDQGKYLERADAIKTNV
jgi:hypothetical protein